MGVQHTDVLRQERARLTFEADTRRLRPARAGAQRKSALAPCPVVWEHAHVERDEHVPTELRVWTLPAAERLLLCGPCQQSLEPLSN